ncbi:MAG: hypothetical protein KA419_19445 [Acidobacteria bacterium]|nr:hypothetical protein [Acidobacteriota bacterium]
MKSMTIHGINERLENELKKKARHEKTSLNKVIKETLEKGLGLTAETPDHRGDFVDFCGVWSEEDLTEFNNALTDKGQL